MNDENLAPPFTPGEAAREAGRRGAAKANEIKREKKRFKQALLALMDATHEVKGGKKKKGWDLMATALFKKGASGYVRAIEDIIEMVDEKPVQKQHVEVSKGHGFDPAGDFKEVLKIIKAEEDAGDNPPEEQPVD